MNDIPLELISITEYFILITIPFCDLRLLAGLYLGKISNRAGESI
jgi:hypothetical protein